MDPSPNASDAYGRKWSGNASAAPSNTGGVHRWGETGGVAGGAVAADSVTGACSSASHDAAASGGSRGRASFAATWISTSPVARVSYSGRMAGPAEARAVVRLPDSGSASTHVSRNE